MMKAYYNDIFVLPLPDGHRFPMSKYRLLRERIIAEGIIASENLLIPEGASDEQILYCHSGDYLEKVKTGTLERKEITRIGFPWSLELVERSRRSSGATICAARTAIAEGVSANLAGGTHHAGRDFGAGYSVFCDSGIAARVMQAENLAERIAVIDCDVHQGNGTADVTRGNDSIFTFSIHGERNFPFRKISGDLDIGLADNTGDSEYLETLEIAVERILYMFQPDLVIYQSGADPYIGDKLGKLALTKEGLAQRDKLVLEMCRSEDIPVAVTMGGGYAEDVHDIVDIHAQTIRIATEFVR
ncbi:MAG: histone deacetylase [Phototrophicaceae bacterium]